MTQLHAYYKIFFNIYICIIINFVVSAIWLFICIINLFNFLKKGTLNANANFEEFLSFDRHPCGFGKLWGVNP